MFFLSACHDDRSKKNYNFTTAICDNRLFVEEYTVSGGGALGSDIVSNYLTDSTNFRIYIGTYDNGEEHYYYECRKDSIYIERVSDKKSEEPKAYDLSKLKNSKVFE